MTLTSDQIQAMNQVTGLNKPVDSSSSALDARNQELRDIAAKAKASASNKPSLLKTIIGAPATMLARPVQALQDAGAYVGTRIEENRANKAGDTAGSTAILQQEAQDQNTNTTQSSGPGGIVAPMPNTMKDVSKDAGRAAQTVAFGMGPVSGGATFGAGMALEGGSDLSTLGGAADIAFKTVLGAAGGKILETVGKPIFNVAGKVVGKVTPQYLKDLAGKGTQAIEDFASSHDILPAAASNAINKGADFAENAAQVPFEAAYNATVKPLKKTATAITTKSPAQVDKFISEQYQKGVRPSVTGNNTASQLEASQNKQVQAIKTIVENKPNLKIVDQYGEPTKTVPRTLNEFTQAIEQTKDAIFKKYDALQKQAGETGAKVDLKPVVSELDIVSNDKIMNDLYPEVVKYAQTRSETLNARGSYTPEEAQNAIKTLNNSLSAFYKNPSYDTASKASIDSLIVNKMREGLDSTIENNSAPGYQELKNQYGAVRSIEKDVTHRAIVDGRKNTIGLMGSIGDIASGAELVRGLITMNPADMAASATIKGISAYVKYLNNPNTAIKRLFQAADQQATKATMQSARATATGISQEVSQKVSQKTSANNTPRLDKVKEYIKDNPPSAGLSMKDISSNIHPEDLATMKDFTSYVAGDYNPSEKAAAQLQKDAQDIADRYGFKWSASNKALSNQFGRVIEKQEGTLKRWSNSAK